MAASRGKCVPVWEWETNDPGIFVPYDEEASNFIELEMNRGRQSADLSQVNDSQSAWTIDFPSMTQMSSYQGRKRTIRRKLYPRDCLIGVGIVWEFISDLDWQQFDVATSSKIEDHYNVGTKQLDLQPSLGLDLTINFATMTLRSRAYYSVKRIRRRQLQVPYVGGSVGGQIPMVIPARRLPPISKAATMRRRSRSTSSEESFEIIDHKQDEPQAKTCQLRKAPIKHQALRQLCDSCGSVERDEECSICLDELANASSTYGAGGGNSVVELKLCHHKFHESCLEQCYESGNKDGSMQCPICKTIHGTKQGNQPQGTMTVTRTGGTIPGHPRAGCIQITYNIPPGIQGPNHPSPGQPYIPIGFPRVAYLPDNAKGRKVLQLLQTAWNRKLIFTVGTSVTSGIQNAVVWNEIHHKTEAHSNSSGHGYPDPNYLDNVLQELKSQGVE